MYIRTSASVCTYVPSMSVVPVKCFRSFKEISVSAYVVASPPLPSPPLPSPAAHHHAGLLSCSSESSLHTLHRRKGGGDTATQSTPDLGSLARKSGSAATGKPPLQPKKVQPVEGGSPKASSKGAHVEGNQVSELP